MCRARLRRPALRRGSAGMRSARAGLRAPRSQSATAPNELPDWPGTFVDDDVMCLAIEQASLERRHRQPPGARTDRRTAERVTGGCRVERGGDDRTERRPDAADADHPRRSDQAEPPRRLDIGFRIDGVEGEALGRLQLHGFRSIGNLRHRRSVADAPRTRCPTTGNAFEPTQGQTSPKRPSAASNGPRPLAGNPRRRAPGAGSRLSISARTIALWRARPPAMVASSPRPRPIASSRSLGSACSLRSPKTSTASALRQVPIGNAAECVEIRRRDTPMLEPARPSPHTATGSATRLRAGPSPE